MLSVQTNLMKFYKPKTVCYNYTKSFNEVGVCDNSLHNIYNMSKNYAFSLDKQTQNYTIYIIHNHSVKLMFVITICTIIIHDGLSKYYIVDSFDISILRGSVRLIRVSALLLYSSPYI